MRILPIALIAALWCGAAWALPGDQGAPLNQTSGICCGFGSAECPVCPGGSNGVFTPNEREFNHPQRTYTLAEIDRMRTVVRRTLSWAAACTPPQTNGTVIVNGNPSCAEVDILVEERVQTYLLAGVSPETLEAGAKP